MITTRKFAISAIATLGLFAFGAAANAGHPLGGKEMGHGPVVNSSGKIGKEPGKFDKNHKEWEHKYWNRDTCRYEYCVPPCTYAVETYAPVCEVPVVLQPVCEVPVCPEPAYVPTCYPCSYDFCKPYEFHKHCDDNWYGKHRPLDSSKPTTASSHRNTENLGSTGSHVASQMSSGRGRK